MHLVGPLLVVALITPLSVAGPRGGRFFRRTGDDDTNKDLSSTTTSPLTSTLTLASSPLTSSTLSLEGLSSSTPLPSTSGKDEPTSTISNPSKDTATSSTSTSDKDKDTSTSTASTSSKDEPITTVPSSSKDKELTTSLPLKDDQAPTTVLANDQTASSSVPARTLSATESVGTSYGTGSTSASESIQELVVTDVVYTTLTTCPVTSTVTSGNSAIERVTTTISTVTLTSTSTICTKCVAPPKRKPEIPSTSGDETIFSSLPSFVLYSLAQPPSGLPPSQLITSSKAETTSTGGPPVIVYSLTLPKVPLTTTTPVAASSKPETALSSSASSFSETIFFPSSVSLTMSTASIPSIPGYSIVPSPVSVPGGPGPLSNATSSIIPLYSAALLGNAYGGGFIHTPSIYVTKISSPSGPSKGFPPGYGFSSTPEILATATPYLSATIAENVISSGILETIPVNFPTITIGGGNGSNIIPLATASKDEVSKGSSSVLTAIGVTLVAASISGFSETTIANVTSQGVTTLQAALATSGLPSGSEQNAPFIMAQSSSLVTVSSAKIGGASTPAIAVPALAISVSRTSGLPIESEQNAPFIMAQLSSLVTVSSAKIGGASTPAITVPALAISVSRTSGLPIESEQNAPFIVAQSSLPAIVSSGYNGGTSIPATAVPALATSGLTSEVEQIAPFIVAQSSSLAIVSSGTNEGASMSGLSPIVIANSANLPIPQITSLAGEEGAGTPGSAPAAIASSQSAAFLSTTGTTEASGFSIAAPDSLVLESSLLAPTNVRTTGTIETFPSSLVIVAGAPFMSTTAVSEAQTPTPAQIAATILTPVVGANGLTSLAFVPSPNEITPYATALTPPEAVGNLASPTGVATPALGVNSLTSFAVIPSPVVGANGLTSLAVFSTPISAANGLTSPAVILTPVVGANGLTSLAILATPVIGANGLTSLAIGAASEQGATIAQPNVTLAPIEESILIAPEAAPSASQIGIPAPPLILPLGASNIVLSSGSAVASFGNASVHVLLNPTAIAEFQGSAARLSLGCGIGLLGFFMFCSFYEYVSCIVCHMG
ncbi:hypothetical protein N7G274_007720 [Stereocaulon virgatum]|uniref:Uncharacterized protein n=1 Tax=Stereocaulon virgatum TaxID=373712 RepID=A0ABR4A1E5_9LECA